MPETESTLNAGPFAAKNLFSRHFLNVHLKSMDEWKETEKAHTAFQCVRKEYEKHKEEPPTSLESQLDDKFIRPVLKCLGQICEVQASAPSGRTDYAFFADEESAREAVINRGKDDFYLKTIAVGDTKEAQGQRTIEKNPDLVWYASYGSNLLESRFMCYIEGGQPEGSRKVYKGCNNKAPPKDAKPIGIPHELYFSKESETWGNMAVAFVKSERIERSKTLGRMYLITKDQFMEVVRQENCLDPGDKSIEIHFEDTISDGESIVSRNWYGRIIHLGYEDGYPIFTFTGTWDDDDITLGQPGGNYLRTIVKGIKQAYDMSDDDLVQYLWNIVGIKGKIDEKTIREIVGTS